MLTLSRLHELLEYRPESGQLVWRVWKGNKAPAGSVAGTLANGYVKIWVDKRQLLAHRVAWAMHYGEWPKGELDHINGVRDDNRIENLREATSQENKRNQGSRKSNTSGYKGVSWHKQRQRWRASIFDNYKQRHLGLFDTPEEAYQAYVNAAKKLHGDFYTQEKQNGVSKPSST